MEQPDERAHAPERRFASFLARVWANPAHAGTYLRVDVRRLQFAATRTARNVDDQDVVAMIRDVMDGEAGDGR